MTDFKLHDIDSAPDDAKPLLEGSKKNMGMIPSLHAVMAEAPQLLEGYQALHGLFTNTSLDANEQSVVWLSISVENECHYCVPAHTGIALKTKVPEDVVEALRNGETLPDRKLEALRVFTLAVVSKRGKVSKEDLNAFYEAGYGQRQVLEVILGVAQKTMSNYVNHIAETPVDEPFKKFEWKKSS